MLPGMDKMEALALARSKLGAWESRRLLACAELALTQGTSQACTASRSQTGAQPGFGSGSNRGEASSTRTGLAAALRIKDPHSVLAGQRFRELALAVHPDKNPGDEAVATAAFQFLQAAFRERGGRGK